MAYWIIAVTIMTPAVLGVVYVTALLDSPTLRSWHDRLMERNRQEMVKSTIRIIELSDELREIAERFAAQVPSVKSDEATTAQPQDAQP